MVKKSLTREYTETLGEVYKKRGFLAAIDYELRSTLHSIGSRIANAFDSFNVHTPTYQTSTGAGGWTKGSEGEIEYLEGINRIRSRTKGRHEFLLRQKRAKKFPGEEERIELRHRYDYSYQIVLSRPGEKEEPLGHVGFGAYNDVWHVFGSIYGNPDSEERYDKIKSRHKANSIALKEAYRMAKKISKQRNLPLEHLIIEDAEEREDKKLADEIDSLKSRRISSIIFISLGIIISALSIRATGNVIGSLTKENSGLLGVFLLLFGFAGFFLSHKKKQVRTIR